MRVMIFQVLALCLLAACGNGDRSLRGMQFRETGPIETLVIPSRPLIVPGTLTLPTPTPGGTNRADPTTR